MEEVAGIVLDEVVEVMNKRACNSLLDLLYTLYLPSL